MQILVALSYPKNDDAPPLEMQQKRPVNTSIWPRETFTNTYVGNIIQNDITGKYFGQQDNNMTPNSVHEPISVKVTEFLSLDLKDI